MRMKTMAAFAATLIALPAQLSAAPAPQSDGNGSWAAWYGCWRAVDGDPAAMVCVLPGEAAGVARIANVANSAIVSETLIRADGTSQQVEEGGCTGTERAWFSSDGRRVFTRADLVCEGMKRTSTGVMGMISEVAWVDAQAVTVFEENAARSVMYRLVPHTEVPQSIAAQLPGARDLAQEAARIHAAAPLDVPAVIEMSRAIAAPAAEALLAARAHGFGMDGRKLVQLADAGVPRSTIDVMVALSHPTKFAVADRSERADAFAMERDAYVRDSCLDYEVSRRYIGGYEECQDARMGRRGFGSYYRSGYGYGYGYGRGYSPFGYDPYGWNRGGSPIVVIVRPGDDGEPTTRGGEVVKGRGYTRAGTSAPTRTAEPRRPVDTRSEPSSVKNSGGSSSGSSATTSSGSGSSSSGSTTTRTARPRGDN